MDRTRKRDGRTDGRTVRLLYASQSSFGGIKSYELDTIYSKTCLKRLLKNKTKIVFQDQLSLNEGQKYCKLLQESILQYFWPSLSYHLYLRPLFCLFLSGCLKQVLLFLIHINMHWMSLCRENIEDPLSRYRGYTYSFSKTWVHLNISGNLQTSQIQTTNRKWIFSQISYSVTFRNFPILILGPNISPFPIKKWVKRSVNIELHSQILSPRFWWKFHENSKVTDH